MNTYQQIEKLCKPIIAAYHTDLTIHDRQTLKKYKGPFLLVCRQYGTYLLKMPCTPQQVRQEYYYSFLCSALHMGIEKSELTQFTILKYYTRTHDDPVHLFYFDGNKIQEITETKAESLLNAWFNTLQTLIEEIEFRDAKTEILSDFVDFISPKYTQIWNGSTSNHAKYITFQPVELSNRTKINLSTLHEPTNGHAFAGGKIKYWLDVNRKKAYYKFS